MPRCWFPGHRGRPRRRSTSRARWWSSRPSRSTSSTRPRSKAWRADTRARAAYERTGGRGGRRRPDEIIVQEMVPGDGDGQLAYCALYKDGGPVADDDRPAAPPAPVGLRPRQHVRRDRRASRARRAVGAGSSRRSATTAWSRWSTSRTHATACPSCSTSTRGPGATTRWAPPRASTSRTCCSATSAVRTGTVRAHGRGCAGSGSTTDVPNACRDIWRGRLRLRDYVRSLRGVDTEAVFVAAGPPAGAARARRCCRTSRSGGGCERCSSRLIRSDRSTTCASRTTSVPAAATRRTALGQGDGAGRLRRRDAPRQAPAALLGTSQDRVPHARGQVRGGRLSAGRPGVDRRAAEARARRRVARGVAGARRPGAAGRRGVGARPRRRVAAVRPGRGHAVPVVGGVHPPRPRTPGPRRPAPAGRPRLLRGAPGPPASRAAGAATAARPAQPRVVVPELAAAHGAARPLRLAARADQPGRRTARCPGWHPGRTVTSGASCSPTTSRPPRACTTSSCCARPERERRLPLVVELRPRALHDRPTAPCERLRDEGCEIGVHGLRHDGRDLGSRPGAAQAAAGACGRPPTAGARSGSARRRPSARGTSCRAWGSTTTPPTPTPTPTSRSRAAAAATCRSSTTGWWSCRSPCPRTTRCSRSWVTPTVRCGWRRRVSCGPEAAWCSCSATPTTRTVPRPSAGSRCWRSSART